MTRGGQRPKSDAVLLAEGRGKQTPRGNPVPMPDCATPPAGMSDAAVDVWHQVAGELRRLGLLSLLDRAQMEAYCNFCARYREAVRILDAWPGDKWTKEYRDMLRVERQLYDAMSRAADAFGMTPQSRSRISAPQTPETDEFTELLGY